MTRGRRVCSPSPGVCYSFPFSFTKEKSLDTVKSDPEPLYTRASIIKNAKSKVDTRPSEALFVAHPPVALLQGAAHIALDSSVFKKSWITLGNKKRKREVRTANVDETAFRRLHNWDAEEERKELLAMKEAFHESLRRRGEKLPNFRLRRSSKDPSGLDRELVQRVRLTKLEQRRRWARKKGARCVPLPGAFSHPNQEWLKPRRRDFLETVKTSEGLETILKKPLRPEILTNVEEEEMEEEAPSITEEPIILARFDETGDRPWLQPSSETRRRYLPRPKQISCKVFKSLPTLTKSKSKKQKQASTKAKMKRSQLSGTSHSTSRTRGSFTGLTGKSHFHRTRSTNRYKGVPSRYMRNLATAEIKESVVSGTDEKTKRDYFLSYLSQPRQRNLPRQTITRSLRPAYGIPHDKVAKAESRDSSSEKLSDALYKRVGIREGLIVKKDKKPTTQIKPLSFSEQTSCKFDPAAENADERHIRFAKASEISESDKQAFGEMPSGLSFAAGGGRKDHEKGDMRGVFEETTTSDDGVVEDRRDRGRIPHPRLRSGHPPTPYKKSPVSRKQERMVRHGGSPSQRPGARSSETDKSLPTLASSSSSSDRHPRSSPLPLSREGRHQELPDQDWPSGSDGHQGGDSIRSSSSFFSQLCSSTEGNSNLQTSESMSEDQIGLYPWSGFGSSSGDPGEVTGTTYDQSSLGSSGRQGPDKGSTEEWHSPMDTATSPELTPKKSSRRKARATVTTSPEKSSNPSQVSPRSPRHGGETSQGCTGSYSTDFSSSSSTSSQEETSLTSHENFIALQNVNRRSSHGSVTSTSSEDSEFYRSTTVTDSTTGGSPDKQPVIQRIGSVIPVEYESEHLCTSPPHSSANYRAFDSKSFIRSQSKVKSDCKNSASVPTGMSFEPTSCFRRKQRSDLSTKTPYNVIPLRKSEESGRKAHENRQECGEDITTGDVAASQSFGLSSGAGDRGSTISSMGRTESVQQSCSDSPACSTSSSNESNTGTSGSKMVSAGQSPTPSRAKKPKAEVMGKLPHLSTIRQRDFQAGSPASQTTSPKSSKGNSASNQNLNRRRSTIQSLPSDREDASRNNTQTNAAASTVASSLNRCSSPTAGKGKSPTVSQARKPPLPGRYARKTAGKYDSATASNSRMRKNSSVSSFDNVLASQSGHSALRASSSKNLAGSQSFDQCCNSVSSGRRNPLAKQLRSPTDTLELFTTPSGNRLKDLVLNARRKADGKQSSESSRDVKRGNLNRVIEGPTSPRSDGQSESSLSCSSSGSSFSKSGMRRDFAASITKNSFASFTVDRTGIPRSVGRLSPTDSYKFPTTASEGRLKKLADGIAEGSTVKDPTDTHNFDQRNSPNGSVISQSSRGSNCSSEIDSYSNDFCSNSSSMSKSSNQRSQSTSSSKLLSSCESFISKSSASSKCRSRASQNLSNRQSPNSASSPDSSIGSHRSFPSSPEDVCMTSARSRHARSPESPAAVQNSGRLHSLRQSPFSTGCIDSERSRKGILATSPLPPISSASPSQSPTVDQPPSHRRYSSRSVSNSGRGSPHAASHTKTLSVHRRYRCSSGDTSDDDFDSCTGVKDRATSSSPADGNAIGDGRGSSSMMFQTPSPDIPLP